MSSLQDRYKKAYAELMAAKDENEKMSQQFYAAKGTVSQKEQDALLNKWMVARDRFIKASDTERIVADKIPRQLLREIQGMPLPSDLRNEEIRKYVGLGRRRTRRRTRRRV